MVCFIGLIYSAVRVGNLPSGAVQEVCADKCGFHGSILAACFSGAAAAEFAKANEANYKVSPSLS